MWKPSLKLEQILLFSLLLCGWMAVPTQAETSMRFEVSLKKGITSAPQTGRLFVILSRNDKTEPRAAMGILGLDAPFLLARDVTNLTPGVLSVLDQKAITFPITNLSELPASDYFAQALLSVNTDLRAPDAPGNLYSEVKKIHLDPAHGGASALQLGRQIPAEQLPPDTGLVKFVKMQSQLLSKFYGRPIYLQAGIILPRDFAREPKRKYPLWVRIGGWGARYTGGQRVDGRHV